MNVKAIIEAVGGKYIKENNNKVTIEVSHNGVTFTMTYDLNSVPTESFSIFGRELFTWKVNNSKVYASIVAKTSTMTITTHTDVIYNGGKEYMSALALLDYFEKIFNVTNNNDVNNRPIYKIGDPLDRRDLTNYSFNTEPDAAFAFGYVYGGEKDGEWGARIIQDSTTGKYYIDGVQHKPVGQLKITKVPGMTAAVHTHPYDTASGFSDDSGGSDLTSARDQRINEYAVHPIVENGKLVVGKYEVYQAIYDYDAGWFKGSPTTDPAIGNTVDWFNGKYNFIK